MGNLTPKMCWLSRAGLGLVFALLVVIEFGSSSPYMQKLASIQKLCPSSDLMCPSAATRVSQLQSPGTPKETKALSGRQAKTASERLKKSLEKQASVVSDLDSTTKQLANTASEIKRLKVDRANTLKHAKAVVKSSLCNKVNWSNITPKYCAKGGGGNRCRAHNARVQKAKKLCVKTLPALKRNLQKHHARRLGATSRLQKGGVKRRARRVRRKTKKATAKVKRQKKRAIRKAKPTRKQKKKARKVANILEKSGYLDKLISQVVDLEKNTTKLVSQEAQQKPLQEKLKQLNKQLDKRKKNQNSCTINFGAQPVIAKFSIPARSKGNQARRQLLGETQRRGRARKRRARKRRAKTTRARRRRARKRRASSVQKKAPKKGKRQQRKRTQKKTRSAKRRQNKKSKRQHKKSKQQRRRGSSKTRIAQTRKAPSGQKRRAQKKNVEEIGLCVLNKGGEVPRNNVNLYCASTTQPTLKAEEVRACKTKGEGVVLVKHRKNERVATTDATGKESAILVDYIKVSACGEGKSDNVQCTVKKVLYNCRMEHVKKGQSKECGNSAKRIAIANV